MSDQSNIEWTDSTWNPVRGCTKVSPGCKHCYAETFAERFRGVKGHPYEQGFDLRLVPEKLTEPLRWKTPRRVFVNSMSDLFQDGVPDQFIHDVYFTMEQRAPWHTYQILTKRPARMAAYLEWRYGAREDGGGFRIPSRHLWHGGSVEDQPAADERVPLIMQTRSVVRFLSLEPLLGPVNLDGLWGYPGSATSEQLARWPIQWVIVGGESGHGARPCDVAWVRSIIDQCQQAGVACFVKQLGAAPLVPASRQSHWDYRFSKLPEGKRFTSHDDQRWRLHLADRKGGDPAEWPKGLRVRQFPDSETAQAALNTRHCKHAIVTR